MTSMKRKSREGKTPGVLMPKKPAYLMDRSFLHEKKSNSGHAPQWRINQISRSEHIIAHFYSST